MISKHDIQQNTFNVHVYQLYYVYVLYYGVYYMKFLCIQSAWAQTYKCCRWHQAKYMIAHTCNVCQSCDVKECLMIWHIK